MNSINEFGWVFVFVSREWRFDYFVQFSGHFSGFGAHQSRFLVHSWMVMRKHIKNFKVEKDWV